MFVLLLTENESINGVLSKLAHVIWVKDAQKALNLINEEDFDDILISEPFNRDQALLDQLQKEYVLLNEADDLKKYIYEKKAQKQKNSTGEKGSQPSQNNYSQESVLLVTTNQKTIEELREFNITITTTPFSAHQRVSENDYRAVIWDLPTDYIKVNTLLYVWGRDLKTPEELDFILKNGKLRVTAVNNDPEPTTKVIIAPEAKTLVEDAHPSQIDVKPIELESKHIKQLKQQPPIEQVKPEPAIVVKPARQEESQVPEESKQPVAPKKVKIQKPIEPKYPKAPLWTKTGVIVDNKFIKVKFDDPQEINFDYDALVMTASMGIEKVKSYRRENPLKPIVVLKGNNAFLEAGADKCVRRINSQVVKEMLHLSNRIKELWAKIEVDPLTGLYTRVFMEEWKSDRESRGKGYSVVMLDIDKFKDVNDNYGHDAGDTILASIGEFLKTEVRFGDIVARYGGEEFIVCLPDVTANQAHVIMDRIRQKWSERAVVTSDGKSIRTTFSAGVAEWRPGLNVIKAADDMLYQAKNTGRNQVITDQVKTRVLLLGQIPASELTSNGINVTYDPDNASIAIAEPRSIAYAPTNITLYVLGKGGVADWTIKKERPDAIILPSIQDIINHIKGKPKLQVLPGTRTSQKSQTIPVHGTLYVICPSRPAAAGEIAVNLSRQIKNVGFVCASGSSTAAKILGIPDKTLITADWRIPGANAPIDWEGMKVWPVDPYKQITTSYDIHKLVDEIKNYFSLVIVDCAGNLDLCQRIAYDEGVILVYKEGDASDAITANWMKLFGSKNVMAVSPAEEPVILEAENGFIVNQKGYTNLALRK